MKITDPKVLTIDIETSPLEVFVWGRGEQKISLEQVQKDWFILAFAAKWKHEPASKIIYMDTRGKKWGDDKQLLKKIWELLDEADVVISQNGERFDSRKINARLILNGFNPPSPYKHLDTYKYLSKTAEFTSASLDYLTSKLCHKYKKLKHKKYPGWKLWIACLKGDLEAWKEMKKYNTHDVLSTEELQENTKGWVPRSAPNRHWVSGLDRKCGACGVDSLICRGYEKTNKGLFKKMNCTSCGAWPRGERINGK